MEKKDKPLRDWTLGEIKEYCRKRDCKIGIPKQCPFYNGHNGCGLSMAPSFWPEFRLTKSELAICKAVGAKWVSRDEDGNVWVKLWDGKPDVEVDGDNGRCYYSESGGCVLALVDGNIFKTIRPGDCICVEEAGGNA